MTSRWQNCQEFPMSRSRLLIPFVLITSFIGNGSLGREMDRRAPTVDDLLQLKTINTGRISPAGKYVAYGVTAADFKQDAFVTQLWLVDTASGKSRQLTRGNKSAGNPHWSPDCRWLGFTSER